MFQLPLIVFVGVATFQINSLFKVRHFKENRAEIRPIFLQIIQQFDEMQEIV